MAKVALKPMAGLFGGDSCLCVQQTPLIHGRPAIVLDGPDIQIQRKSVRARCHTRRTAFHSKSYHRMPHTVVASRCPKHTQLATVCVTDHYQALWQLQQAFTLHSDARCDLVQSSVEAEAGAGFVRLCYPQLEQCKQVTLIAGRSLVADQRHLGAVTVFGDGAEKTVDQLGKLNAYRSIQHFCQILQLTVAQ
eukprot:scpid54856/ scgid9612/ 